MNGVQGKKVGVLAGGPSNEREISLKSGRAVYNALIQNGIDAIFLDVYEDVYDIIKSNSIDIAFIALHGRFGEDGTVQKILEDRGIPYTGSGPQASRLALDKIASKDVFKKSGIPIPAYVVVEKERHCEEAKGRRSNLYIDRLLRFACNDGVELPVVVKPQFEGSSIGLSVVRDKSDLIDAINNAFRYGTKIILEEYIDGRELTVGILDDEPLPVIEIVPRKGVYDYKAKYSDPDTKYLVPAPIDDELSEKAKRLGRMAHISLGCRSFSRADMMMDKSGNIFVLEVNTIPGMTERSLLPKAAEVNGLNFGRLCIKLIENALKGISK